MASKEELFHIMTRAEQIQQTSTNDKSAFHEIKSSVIDDIHAFAHIAAELLVENAVDFDKTILRTTQQASTIRRNFKIPHYKYIPASGNAVPVWTVSENTYITGQDDKGSQPGYNVRGLYLSADAEILRADNGQTELDNRATLRGYLEHATANEIGLQNIAEIRDNYTQLLGQMLLNHGVTK